MRDNRCDSERLTNLERRVRFLSLALESLIAFAVYTMLTTPVTGVALSKGVTAETEKLGLVKAQSFQSFI